MVRPYIEARRRFWNAQAAVASAQGSLDELDKPGWTITPGTPMHPNAIERFRADRQQILEKCQAELTEADAAFDIFRRKPKARVFYPEERVFHVRMSRRLGNAIRDEEDKGTTPAELIRQALMEHFGLEDELPAATPTADDSPF